MNSSITFCITLILFAALMPGCAKKEMVKPTQEASPAALSIPNREQSPAGKEEVTQEVVKESAVREETEESAGLTDKADIKKGLEAVYFDFDSYALAPSAREALYRNYRWLSAHPAARVQIEGHCDERGSGEYNLALGEKRAKAAMQYLLTLGSAPERLSFVSYGEEKPAALGHDQTAWGKNRRVEKVVLSER